MPLANMRKGGNSPDTVFKRVAIIIVSVRSQTSPLLGGGGGSRAQTPPPRGGEGLVTSSLVPDLHKYTRTRVNDARGREKGLVITMPIHGQGWNAEKGVGMQLPTAPIVCPGVRE